LGRRRRWRRHLLLQWLQLWQLLGRRKGCNNLLEPIGDFRLLRRRRYLWCLCKLGRQWVRIRRRRLSGWGLRLPGWVVVAFYNIVQHVRQKG
jgi:hypothetical protein